MADHKRFLGIDLGTSGCRACVIDQQATLISLGRAPLPPPMAQAHGGMAQDPQLWWQALEQALAQIRHELPAVVALAVDGTSASVLLTNADGRPLAPALMYHDARATAQAAYIATQAPLGCVASSVSGGLAKLLYLRQTVPGAIMGMHQADWIAGRLLGRFGFSDENNALKTGYDPVRREWPAWLDNLLPPCFLPAQVVAPGTPLGVMAHAVGALSRGTLVVAGTTDSTAGFIACGAQQAGDGVTTLGSTLVVKMLSQQWVNAPQYGIYSHRLGDLWLVGGASNTGGAVLRHFFSLAEITRLSAVLHPERPTGLHYYPLLRPGERFPIADAHYPGCLEPRPSEPGQFFQGILEGISAIEAAGYAKLTALGAPPLRQVFTTGGGAVNEGWRLIRQQALPVPVFRAQHSEAAYGTALLARRGWQQTG